MSLVTLRVTVPSGDILQYLETLWGVLVGRRVATVIWWVETRLLLNIL